ncbi:hypothetical protein KIPE111705_16255 [Kibdelosporangium persicum]|uniref:DUF3558 domain-containing protein n=1 Tax=Kibdelosporangium persicum TaxID=2698649 RepID=A0ABX2EY15_9PSEU|nr:hypothetical protein [Kibdelosporangium persicum]NRN63940.1 hypothetical protein [Kibdelosporangium persicum]
MVRHSFIFVALLCAVACTSEPAPPPPPPAPTTVTSVAAVPPTGGIAVTAEQLAQADPCALMNQDSLAKFGRVSMNIGIAFTECEMTVVMARHDQATVQVAFRFAPPAGAKPISRNGITFHGDEDTNWCRRYIVVSEQSTIFVAASRAPVRGPACEFADAVVDGMVPQLARGELKPAEVSPDSLARHDACHVIEFTEIRRVLGRDPVKLTPAYNRQTCTIDTGGPADPSLLVTFVRGHRPEVDEKTDRAITIDGREAVTDTWAGSGSGANRHVPSCSAELAYRPLDRPMGTKTVERLRVSVYREAPEDTNCQPATDLTAAALRKLGGK